jgi:predicted AAA+ superfamily ATPase
MLVNPGKRPSLLERATSAVGFVISHTWWFWCNFFGVIAYMVWQLLSPRPFEDLHTWGYLMVYVAVLTFWVDNAMKANQAQQQSAQNAQIARIEKLELSSSEILDQMSKNVTMNQLELKKLSGLERSTTAMLKNQNAILNGISAQQRDLIEVARTLSKVITAWLDQTTPARK